MYRTLRGVFAEPEKPARRNFLRENVASIKNKKKSLSQSNLNGKLTITSPGSSKYSSSSSSNNGVPVGKKSYEKPTVNSTGRQNPQKKLQVKHNSEQNLSRVSSTSTVKDQASQTDPNEDHIKNVQWCQRCDKSNLNEPDDEINTDNNLPSKINLEKENSLLSLNKSISTRTLSEAETEHGDNYELKTIHRDKKEFRQPELTNEKRFPKNRCHMMKHSKESVEIPANYKLGEIPEYLKKRKEELARIQKEIDLDDPCCPDGHILLPDDDRKKTLEIVNNKFKALINELNRMPMTAETLKIRQRKMEIEKELNKLEDSIRIFSRAKVYVKLND